MSRPSAPDLPGICPPAPGSTTIQQASDRRRRRMQTQPPVPLPAESADDGPQRRRLPPDERRSEIFRAALAVFSDLGYDRATLSDVVERVGVSKACLYHNFESTAQ